MPNLIERLNRAIDVEYDWKNQEVAETLKTTHCRQGKKGDTIENVFAEFFPDFNYDGSIVFTKLK
jgi:hypothetical protein